MSRPHLCWPLQRPPRVSRTLQSAIFRLLVHHFHSTATMWFSGIRFLGENAASMLEMHYRAFCKLLNIDPTSPDKYLWNPSDFGYQITRRRIFFSKF